MMWFSQQKYIERAFSLLISLLVLYAFFILLPYIELILSFLSVVLLPFAVAVILYYVLRPLVRRLERKIPLPIAILAAYVLMAAAIVFASVFVYPVINDQINSILSINPQEYSRTEHKLVESLSFFGVNLYKLKTMATDYLINLQTIIIKNIGSVFQIATRFLLDFIAVPFILFYLLKDDRKIYHQAIAKVPSMYLSLLEQFLKEIDQEMMKYIFGRVIVSSVVSGLLLISFLSIGLDYPVLLFFSSLVFIFIPTIGSFIATIPVLLVGFSTSLVMGVEAMIIMGVASSLEGFLITPKVMGSTLQIHPLTIIFILLAGGLLFGVFGLIVATPIYAVLKTFAVYLYRLVKLDAQSEKAPSGQQF